jgi:hypothetical protein
MIERFATMDQLADAISIGRLTCPGKPKIHFRTIQNRIIAKLPSAREGVTVLKDGLRAVILQVTGLPSEITRHPKSVHSASYQPCAVDTAIKSCLTESANSAVFHVECVDFKLEHRPSMNLSRIQFEEKVNNVAKRYGFFVKRIGKYTDSYDSGHIFVEVMDLRMAVSFAQEIRKQIPVDPSFDFGQSLMTMTNRWADEYGGGRDKDFRFNPMTDILHRIPDSDIGRVKQIIARRTARHGDSSRWTFNDKHKMLVIPGDQEEELMMLLLQMKDEKGKKLCLYMCEDGAPLLPSPCYIYREDGRVEPCGMCRDCLIEHFRECVKGYFNEKTEILNYNALVRNPERPGVIPVEPNEVGSDGNAWPNVPLGALLWTLMSDRRTMAPYVRAWVTGAVEVCMRTHPNEVMYCPQHPDFAIVRPNRNDQTVKCQYCNFIWCSSCGTWHKMNDACPTKVEGVKHCPFCGLPTFKYSGCNHITCARCNENWCYICEGKFAANTIYPHMQAAHGGYFT